MTYYCKRMNSFQDFYFVKTGSSLSICPSGWLTLDDRCFHVFTETIATVPEGAQEYCESAWSCGKLATVTENTQEALFDFRYKYKYFLKS